MTPKDNSGNDCVKGAQLQERIHNIDKQLKKIADNTDSLVAWKNQMVGRWGVLSFVLILLSAGIGALFSKLGFVLKWIRG